MYLKRYFWENIKPEEKIPSIRDLAIDIEVNPNTVQRTYDLLQQRGIICKRKGIGYFVADDARQKVLSFRREQFMENELPAFLKSMHQLDIDPEKIRLEYVKFVEKYFK